METLEEIQRKLYSLRKDVYQNENISIDIASKISSKLYEIIWDLKEIDRELKIDEILIRR